MWSSRFRGRTEYGEKEGFAAEAAAIDAVRGTPGPPPTEFLKKSPFTCFVSAGHLQLFADRELFPTPIGGPTSPVLSLPPLATCH